MNLPNLGGAGSFRSDGHTSLSDRGGTERTGNKLTVYRSTISRKLSADMEEAASTGVGLFSGFNGSEINNPAAIL